MRDQKDKETLRSSGSAIGIGFFAIILAIVQPIMPPWFAIVTIGLSYFCCFFIACLCKHDYILIRNHIKQNSLTLKNIPREFLFLIFIFLSSISLTTYALKRHIQGLDAPQKILTKEDLDDSLNKAFAPMLAVLPPEYLKAINNVQLKQRTIELASDLRTFDVRWMQALEDEANEDIKPHTSMNASPEEKDRIWAEKGIKMDKVMADEKIEYLNKFRPRIIAIRDELISRLQADGIPIPELPIGRSEDLKYGRLVTQDSLVYSDYLEKLQNALPNN